MAYVYWALLIVGILQAATALIELNTMGNETRGFKTAVQAAMFLLTATAFGVQV